MCITIPTSELGPPLEESTPAVHWHCAPPLGSRTEFSVVLGTTDARLGEDWPGQFELATELVGRLEMRTAGSVWVVVLDTPMQDELVTRLDLMHATLARNRLALEPHAINAPHRAEFQGTLDDWTTLVVEAMMPDYEEAWRRPTGGQR
jgi:hypothetical protein